ncbi:MAG: hypothetical protein WC671_01225 [Candidatus Paceibacterota bacterium]|jgi:hypothetical protein
MDNIENTTDLLQIKIEKAKAELPKETRNAINTVDYKAVILEMRKTKGYTFEQLGDLETETELLLCGLLGPENYPKELANRMHLSGDEVNELVKEMNELVFVKIKESLIKSSEGESDMQILNSAGIEIIDENKKEIKKAPPILAQKLSGSFQVPIVKTEHSIENITKASIPTPPKIIVSKPAIDPYREIPE